MLADYPAAHPLRLLRGWLAQFAVEALAINCVDSISCITRTVERRELAKVKCERI
jgi:hypothetical protein